MRLQEIILVIFYIITAINMFYWLYFFRLSNSKTSKKNITPSNEKGISVVICAHNESENLANFLPKILEQNHSLYEIILVDDRSNDSTKETLSRFKDSRLKIVTISQTPHEWNSKKWALINGVKKAQYEHILFTDADCYPSSEDWISSFHTQLLNHDLVLGYSPYKKFQGILNLFIQYETTITGITYLGFAKRGNLYMAVGRNFATKKSLYLNFSFKDVKHVQGGDDDLFINTLYKETSTALVYDKRYQMISLPKKTWKRYFIQKLRHISVSKHYNYKNSLLIGLYNLSNLLFYLLGVFLLLILYQKSLVIAPILLRTSIIFIIFDLNSRKLGKSVPIISTFLLDIFYTLFLWLWGPIALIAKKIKWK